MIVPRNRDGSGNPILGAEKEGKKDCNGQPGFFRFGKPLQPLEG